MESSLFHFSHPLWLLGLVLIPFVWIFSVFYGRDEQRFSHLTSEIDAHLLPFLLVKGEAVKSSGFWSRLMWSFAWSCLIVSLAGPRWNFRDIETPTPDQTLVVVLDLSESMNATDVKPSRLTVAKQKIEDLLNAAEGVKVGLVAFAADPHMIAPVTDDKETIRHQLASIDTSIVYIQGSRLSPALEMAATMMESEGENRAIVVVSDGGFEDASAIATAKALGRKGIVVHAMGVGSLEGAPLYEKGGGAIKKNGSLVLSKLEKERLAEISRAAGGMILQATHQTTDEKIVLQELSKRAEAQMRAGKINRLWDEHFYLFLLPILIPVFRWARRGALFLLFIAASFVSFDLPAADFFKNSETKASEALERGDFDEALEGFSDPYRKGVASYRAGRFEEAEQLFSQSTRQEVAADAAYNRGNALAMQQKFEEAAEAYGKVLERWPEHTKAKENLEVIKKIMEEKKSQDNQENSDDQKQMSDQKDRKDEKDEKDRKDEKDQKDRKDEKDQKDRNDNNEKGESENAESGDEEKERESLAEEEEREEVLPKEEKQGGHKSEMDQEADQWLNRIVSDPKAFLKNKMMIESKKSGAKEGVDPW